MSIYNVFREKLEKSDPPHGLMLNGVVSASNWVDALDRSDLLDLVSEIYKHLETMSEREKLEVIFVAQKTRNNEFLPVVVKINREGKSIHGEKVAVYASQLISNK